MKWIKAILAAGVSLLAMTAHAHADFIVTPIAFALFAGPLGAVASFTAIYTGVQIAAYAAVLGASLALGARGPQVQKIDPGDWKNTFQEAETSEYNGVGRVKLGGLKAFGNTKGNVISRLIWRLKGPMVAVEQYFLGGREVTVESDGAVSSPPWATPGGSWAYIKDKVGNGSETAWPELLADFPSLWTSAHLCRGIYQSLVRFVIPDFSTEDGNKKFQKLYQGGAPDSEEVARVSPVYDPRVPGQNADDPTTWTWNDNGILCAVHIMREYPDLKSTDFDWTFLAAEANRADALVATKTGTEPRSRCWGIWPSESKRGDVMQQVLDSLGAEVVLSDAGLIRIRLIDDSPTSEITFTSKHIVNLNWKSGPDAVERPNVCRIKYYSPERGYDMGEINMTGIAWARIDSEIARYGEKVFDVELPFCPSASQAQRIARRLFMQARADSGSIDSNMAGLAAWGITYADIEDADEDAMMLCRLASPRIDDGQGTVEIPYIVWPQALIDQPWNPATMEAAAPTPAPDLQYESELPDPAAPVEATVVQYPGGAFETRTRFAGVPGGTIAEAVYRTYTGGEPNAFQSMTEYQGGGIWFGYDAANSVGGRVDVKSRFFNDDDEGSYYSPLLTVNPMAINNTACAAPTINVTVDHIDGNPNYTFHVSVHATDLRVARLGVSGSASFDGNARPYQPQTFTFSRTAGGGDIVVTINAIAYTSNGTPSPTATWTTTIPGSGGGGD